MMHGFKTGFLLGILYGLLLYWRFGTRQQALEITMPEVHMSIDADDDDGGEYAGTYRWLN